MECKILKVNVVFLFFITFASAQTQDELNTFNKERLRIQKKGMAVLGTWAIGNIAWGVAGTQYADGSAKKFHEMNALWNGVNLLLAAPGYIGAAKGKYEFNFRKSYKEQKNVEKTFLVNSALDVAYMMGGLYLIEKSKNTIDPLKSSTNLGYGNSILFQGGFLMAFDMAMYIIHNRHGNKKLMPYLDAISLSSTGIGFRKVF